MKIDDSYKNMPLINSSRESTVNKKVEEQPEQTLTPKNKGGSVTEVDFSKTSVEFSKAAEIIEQDAMARNEKVNQIKAMVENGTYEIDAKKVADKILGDALAGFMES